MRSQPSWARLFPVALFVIAALPLSCRLKVETPPDTFRMNINSEPPNIDWNLATDSSSFRVLEGIMEGLTRFDGEIKPQPALAESWSVSPDGKTYAFRLRKGVKWTDGVELKARHFVDGWLRALDPATAAEYAYFLYDVENAEAYNRGEITDPSMVGVSAPSDYILVVRLDKPIVFFPSITTFMTTYPVRLDVIDKWGDSWTEPEHIVTLGPYRLKTWRHEYKIELERNPTYWGKAPATEKIMMHMIGEENAALDLYQSGALDYASVPSYAAPFMKDRPDYRHLQNLNGYYYGFNVTKPPFDDPRVRRAFSMAVDRGALRDVLHGAVEPSSSWLPPGLLGHNPSIGFKFAPREAKELLRQAGYDSPADLPEITLAFNTNDTHKIVAENIKEQWKENLGVDVRLKNMEWKVYLQLLKDDPPQLFRLGWFADYPDPDNFMAMFKGNSGNNHTRWSNEEFDRLVETAAGERDPAKRKEIYDRAQRILIERDCAIMPLFFSSLNRLVSPRVEGFKLNIMDRMFFEKIRLK